MKIHALAVLLPLLVLGACKVPEETRFFNFDGDSTPEEALKSGWSFFEEDGETNTYVWATGLHADLSVTSRGDGDRTIRFRGMPFVFPKSQPQTVRVRVNGRDVATVRPTEGFRIYSAFAPHSVWRRGENSIAFDFTYAESPQTTVHANDLRPLAFAFDWLEIEPARAAAKH